MLHIDLTNQSSVYRSLGPQGLWHWHRFGSRNRNCYQSISFDNSLRLSKSFRHIHAECHYGDAACYQYLISLAEELRVNDKKFTVVTRCGFDRLRAKELANRGVTVKLHLDGIDQTHGTVNLGAQWDLAVNTMKEFGQQCTVIFDRYTYNWQDDPSILNSRYGCNIIERSGFVYGDGIAPVIDQNGKWLYDVRTVGDSRLSRSLDGHAMIRYYTKSPEGASIAAGAAIPKRFSQFSSGVQDPQVHISADGMVHPNRNHWETWCNSLAGDWDPNLFDINKNHECETAGILYKYSKINLDEINIQHNLEDITSSPAWRYLTNPTVS